MMAEVRDLSMLTGVSIGTQIGSPPCWSPTPERVGPARSTSFLSPSGSTALADQAPYRISEVVI